ncbi:unnamed protein product [Lymnaea stagnalis]|uniref:Uncharacterized protein n=1 Tax=Lymnaea stagnalis TaxID=6523 RepID=A0AAV2HBW1_LYMST
MEKRKTYGSSVHSSQSGISIISTTSTWTAASLEPDPESADFIQAFRDLNKEAESPFEYVSGAHEIVCSTLLSHIFMVALTIFAVSEACIGVRYLTECPEDSRIPVFLFVGGCIGALKAIHVMYSIHKIKRHSQNSMMSQRADEIVDVILNIFLLVWQGLGMYWIFSVWWPPETEPLYVDPDEWCDQTCYLFAVVQTGVAGVLIVGKALMLCVFLCMYLCAK